jgi:hypothetical protein
MYKDVLQHIAGVEIYPIISLALFLFASVLVGLRVWRMTRKEVQDMSTLPLDDREPIAHHDDKQARRD